ncbi:MAG: hypothetical protein LUG64_09090, partial [Clostridiales bacterium]|nr:hypothetical protein [Clostridiales bacterium]
SRPSWSVRITFFGIFPKNVGSSAKKRRRSGASHQPVVPREPVDPVPGAICRMALRFPPHRRTSQA